MMRAQNRESSKLRLIQEGVDLVSKLFLVS